MRQKGQITSPNELAPLKVLIASEKPRLIGIDGMNGVGKSRRIARHLGLPVIALDDFLLGNGEFIGGIKYAALRAAIGSAERPAIVEGCCLLAVLAQIDVSIDLHVYARRVSDGGLWYEQDVGEGDDPDHALKVERAIARSVRGSRTGLPFDLIRYHAIYRPAQRADIIVDLVERPAD